MPSAIKLIVGLGNPGPEHLMNRHNTGFWFVDVLAKKYSLSFRNETRFKADVCRLTDSGIDCLICKPMTFMNRSGQSVQAIASYYKIPVNEILVVHDEIDFAPGTIRLKEGGGHAGHNGIRDIIEKLGSNKFKRLRIGVGHPGDSAEVVNSVLSRPSAEDTEKIMESISIAIDLIPQLLAGEFQKVMHKLHTSQTQVTSDKSQEDKNND